MEKARKTDAFVTAVLLYALSVYAPYMVGIAPCRQWVMAGGEITTPLPMP